MVKLTNAMARQMSQSLVQMMERDGLLADYSLNSLVDVEIAVGRAKNLVKFGPGGEPVGDISAAMLIAFGCYVGEVFREAYGGDWSGEVGSAPPNSWCLTFPTGSQCWPIEKLRKRFYNGEEDDLIAYAVGVSVFAVPREGKTGRSKSAGAKQKPVKRKRRE